MKPANEDNGIGPIKRILLLLGSLGAVVAIGFADRLTGTEISFSIFYLLPTAFAFWLAGLWPGVVTAAAGAAVWLAADLTARHQYAHPLIPYWNAIMRGIIFLVVGVLLVRLRGALERETHLATRDALTGVGNWRHFAAVAGRELGRARRSGKPLSVAYIDLDDFKIVNDSRGHQAGDAILVSVASTLQESVRTIDCVARLGGDEFVILMPDTEAQGARAVVERIRTVIEQTLKEGRWPATFSAGLVTFERLPASVDEMIKTADELMYSVKKGGKSAIKVQVVGDS